MFACECARACVDGQLFDLTTHMLPISFLYTITVLHMISVAVLSTDHHGDLQDEARLHRVNIGDAGPRVMSASFPQERDIGLSFSAFHDLADVPCPLVGDRNKRSCDVRVDGN